MVVFRCVTNSLIDSSLTLTYLADISLDSTTPQVAHPYFPIPYILPRPCNLTPSVISLACFSLMYPCFLRTNIVTHV